MCPACTTRVRLAATDRQRTLARLVTDARRLHAESRDLARRGKPIVTPSAPPANGPRVLVVDDDALIRDALRLILEELGAHVTEAVDGRQAIEQLEAGRFDLVLCDLRMPEVDGFAVIRRIRGDLRWRDLPVVAVSAVGPGGGPDRVREAGFDAQLHKPFDLNDLVEALDSVGRRAA
jgi:CheY-like chemotaxis protein